MRDKTKITAVFIALMLILPCVLSQGPMEAVGSLLDCNLPPFVGVSAKPNFLMVVDHSGSMQQMTTWNGGGSGMYTASGPDGESGSWCDDMGYLNYLDSAEEWQPDKTYFGAFDMNKFYEYVPANGTDGAYFQEFDNDKNGDGSPDHTECTLPNPPEIQVTHLLARDDSSNFVNTVCFLVDDNPADHFVSGEKVKVKGLAGKYAYFNDKMYTIRWMGNPGKVNAVDEYGNPMDVPNYYVRVAVTPQEYDDVGDTMTIYSVPGGTGVLTREVRGALGSLDVGCISGHVLNWMTATRIGAARIALVGGKGEYVYVDHDNNATTPDIKMYERRAEGIRAYAYDNEYDPADAIPLFSGGIYRRSGAQDAATGVHHPTHYRLGQYHEKDVYLSIGNIARGTLEDTRVIPVVGVIKRTGYADQIGFVTAFDGDTGATDPDNYLDAGDEIIITGLTQYGDFNGKSYKILYVGSTGAPGAEYYIRCEAPAEYAAWTAAVDTTLPDAGLAARGDDLQLVNDSASCTAPTLIVSAETFDQTTHLATRESYDNSVVFCNNTSDPSSFISSGGTVKVSGTGFSFLDGQTFNVEASGGPWLSGHYYVRVKGITQTQWEQVRDWCGGDEVLRAKSGIVLEDVDDSEYVCGNDSCGNSCSPVDSDGDSTPDTCLCGGGPADAWMFTIPADQEVRIDLERADRDSNNDDWDPMLMVFDLSAAGTTDPADMLSWLRTNGGIKSTASGDDRLDISALPFVGSNNDRDNFIDDDPTKGRVKVKDVHGEEASVWDKDSTVWSKGTPTGGVSVVEPTYLSGDNLTAGTYLVVVITSDAINQDGDMDYFLLTNKGVKLQRIPHDKAGTADYAPYNESIVSNMGTIFDARLRVRLPEEEGEGFIQDGAPFVRFGWMHYTTQDGKYGELIDPCQPREGAELDRFVNMIKGKYIDSGGNPHYTRIPRGGTPAGEALGEAYDYFARHSYHGYTDNSHDWPLVDWGDPFIDPKFDSSGNPKYDGSGNLMTEKAACRKSVAVLISDGLWNHNWDPMATAWELNTGNRVTRNGWEDYSVSDWVFDLRPSDLTGTQICQVYTIFAFAREDDGVRGLQTTAAFGTFVDDPDSDTTDGDPECIANFPYPFSGIPVGTNSKEIHWPLTTSPWDNKCDPDTTYDERCCREWDEDEEVVDSEGNQVKGIPDSFFLAEDGAALRTAMQQILADLLQGTAAAGAVATVSQEVYGGDLIIRAAFEAVDPDNPSHYAWYGHLEGYWPYLKDGLWTTEYNQNPGKLCYEMDNWHVVGEDSSGNPVKGVDCWDAAEILYLDLKTNGINSRKILAKKFEKSGGSIVPASPGAGAYKNTIMELPIESELEGTGTEDKRDIWSSLLQVSVPGDINDSGELGELVNWLRGAKDENIDPTKWRERYGWLYGDIVYSTPVVGGIPPIAGISNNDHDERPDCADCLKMDGRDGYQRYRNKRLAEMYPGTIPTPTLDNVVKRVVFVGANDGMVHAVVAAVWNWNTKRWVTQRPRLENGSYSDVDPYGKFIGRELWSFVPSATLTDLKDLAHKDYAKKSEGCPVEDITEKGKHRDMVDLSEQIWQVFIKPPGGCDTIDPGTPDEFTPERCWRSVLIGGQRGGGDSYFALDVTDPDEPRLMWEYSVINDMVLFTGTAPNFDVQQPTELINNYNTLRNLPMSWTEPFVGRIKVPSSTEFHTGAAPLTATSLSSALTTATEFNPLSVHGGTITANYSPHKRHVAFIGAKFQMYDDDLEAGSIKITDAATNELLKQPLLLAIDVEKGENLFKYIWPWVYSDLTISKFPEYLRGLNVVPCSFADPSVVDVWRSADAEAGDDGYIDHLFAGDLCGNLWGIKFLEFDESPPGTTGTGLSIEMWPTRTVDETVNTFFPWSDYRTVTQPINYQPAISLSPKEAGSEQHLRIIVGAGKYDNTLPPEESDRTDPATMSLYNLAFPINASLPSAYDSHRDLAAYFGNFHLWFKYWELGRSSMFDATLRTDAYSTDCTWTRRNRDDLSYEDDGEVLNTQPDCCKRDDPTIPESRINPNWEDNGDPLQQWWKCVYDFTLPDRLPWGCYDGTHDATGKSYTCGWDDFGGAPDTTPSGLPGERVLHRPLIANNYVFVTTYLPPSKVCEPGGRSYLYIFDYMCRPLPGDFQLPPDSPFTLHMLWGNTSSGGVPFGAVIDLGTGMASEAVLSGDHLIIQMTDGTILNPDNPDPPKSVDMRSWKEVPAD